ncbi:MAG TPA: hypothetical protein PLA39_09305 [Methanoculleus sp.]|nr:hypothetical protein [Methanoculleus sp.]
MLPAPFFGHRIHLRYMTHWIAMREIPEEDYRLILKRAGMEA